MNSKAIARLLLTLSLVAAPLRAIASPQSDILAAEKALNAAVMRHDRVMTGESLTSDYALTLGSGAMYDRPAFLALVADPSLVYTSNQAHDQVVRLYGDDAAVITGILDVKGTYGSHPLSLHMRYTDTWIKEDGKWLQAAGHSSNLPATSP